jgi:hypothetical protein
VDLNYNHNLGIKKNEYILIDLNKMKNKNDIEKIIELSINLKIVFLNHYITIDDLKTTGYYEKIIKNNNIILQDSLDYIKLISLLSNCKYVITDNSILQEESNLLNKRCFTIKKNTELQSTLMKMGGTNQLINRISEIVDHFDKELIKEECSDKINNFITLEVSTEIKHIIYSLYNSIIIPLGYGCRNSGILKQINLRNFSLPFDYINCDLKELLNIMKENFIFANEENLIIENDRMYSKIYGTKSNIFLHYNDKYRYMSLINRFKNILKTPNIHFESIYLNNGLLYRSLETYIHQYIELNEYINNNYNTNIKCFVINNNHYNFLNDITFIDNTEISNTNLYTPLEICNQIKQEIMNLFLSNH